MLSWKSDKPVDNVTIFLYVASCSWWIYSSENLVPTKQHGVMLKEVEILTFITAATSNLRISKYYCDHQLNKSM